MNLQELKCKTPAELLAFAEELQIENASTLRKQDMMFAILKTLAEEGIEISGSGTMEVVQDGYAIGERVLRPALVGVSKGGPKAPVEPAAAGADEATRDA